MLHGVSRTFALGRTLLLVHIAYPAHFFRSAVFDHTPDLLKYYRKHLLLADSGLSYKRFLRPELLASGAMDHFRLNTQSPFDEGLLLLLPGIWGVIKRLWDSASDGKYAC